MHDSSIKSDEKTNFEKGEAKLDRQRCKSCVESLMEREIFQKDSIIF